MEAGNEGTSNVKGSIIVKTDMSAVSKYDLQDQTWKRLPYKGYACLVDRSLVDRSLVDRSLVDPSTQANQSYAFMVIDAADNVLFALNFSCSLEYRNLTSFLMLKECDDHIYCIQFFDPDTQASFYDQLNEIVHNLKRHEMQRVVQLKYAGLRTKRALQPNAATCTVVDRYNRTRAQSFDAQPRSAHMDARSFSVSQNDSLPIYLTDLPDPATIAQLKNTFLQLFQTDAKFVDKIHSAYIESSKK